MPKVTVPKKKPVAKQSVRKLEQPKYKSFRLSKRLKQPKPKLTGSFRLLIKAIKTLLKRPRLFGGIILVYLILTIVLVKGFGVGQHITTIKDALLQLFEGSTAQLSAAATSYAVLLGNAGSSSSDAGNAYQTMLLLIMSVIFIWALRQSMAKKKEKITIRDAFYKGLYPLIPFLLVLIVVALQLLPLLLANFLYNVIIGGGLAATMLEKVLWGILFGLMALLTLYMVSSSIIALYIVTLPDVKPMQALRSARDLVRFRRWMIMRKLLFLPVSLLVLSAVIVIPIIIWSPAVAEWVFFVLSMAALALVHSYIYTLYRELL